MNPGVGNVELVGRCVQDGDKLGRELVELQTKRTERKITPEDAMKNLELTPKEPLSPQVARRAAAVRSVLIIVRDDVAEPDVRTLHRRRSDPAAK